MHVREITTLCQLAFTVSLGRWDGFVSIEFGEASSVAVEDGPVAVPGPSPKLRPAVVREGLLDLLARVHHKGTCGRVRDRERMRETEGDRERDTEKQHRESQRKGTIW